MRLARRGTGLDFSPDYFVLFSHVLPRFPHLDPFNSLLKRWQRSDCMLMRHENQVYGQIKEILATARAKAYSAVNFAMVEA